jgi:hypothetical protein
MTAPAIARAGRTAAVPLGAGAAALVLVPPATGHALHLVAGVALLAVAILAARLPAAACAALMLVAGSYGTIAAYAPALRPADVVQGLAVAAWLAAAVTLLLRGRERPLALWPSVLLLGAFFGVTAVQAALSPSVGSALRSLAGQELPLSLVLLGAVAPWTPAARRAMARAGVAVCALVGAYACVRYAVGPSVRELSAALADPANRGYRRSGDIPLFGSFPLPKALGGWTAVTVPFCVAHALLDRGAWRALAAASAVLGVVANLGSDTRTALVAVVAGTVVVLVAHAFCRAASPLRVAITVAALLAAAAIGVAGFALTQGGDRETRARYGELLRPGASASYQERRARWDDAWRSVRDAPLGGGLGSAGNVRQAQGDFFDVRGKVDSSYVKIALEQGVVLVVLLSALAVLLAELLVRGAAATEPWRAGAALGGAGALTAMLVLMYAGVYAETTPAYAAWLLTGLGAGALLSPGASGTRRAARPPRAAPRASRAARRAPSPAA